MKGRGIVLFFSLGLALASCALRAGVEHAPAILFPADGSSFQEGAKIILSSSETGTWNSSIDGLLGEGSGLTVELTAGAHRIECRNQGGASSISLIVIPPSHDPGRQDTIIPTLSGTDALFAPGGYAPVILSASEKMEDISISMENAGAASAGRMDSAAPSTALRDVRLTCPGGIISTFANDSGPSARRLMHGADFYMAEEKVGDEMVFRMANPEIGTGMPGYSLVAELIYSWNGFAVWLDKETPCDMEALEWFEEVVGEIAMPRALSLYGSPPDPDGNGRIDIVLSKKLNDGGFVIGFFNPCDFFPPCDDIESESYNPTSNGRDILYAGFPEAASGDQEYSPHSIAATLAHEYQHAVRFAKKTYSRAMAGDPDPPVEDSAFDEAVSHFTESLVGLGLSGGNLLFAQRYLKSTSMYALKGPDADGALDSAGKRGCGSLFISYLFERAGGGTWTKADPLAFHGDKAIEFLRDSQQAESSGWKRVENYFKENLADLWKDFCFSINKRSFSVKGGGSSLDILTGEPTGLDPFLGSYPYGEWNIDLNGPLREDTLVLVRIAPWTVRFGSAYSFDGKTKMNVQMINEGSNGNILMGMLHI